ncbi:alpha/beta hydrolase [Roseococcus sp. DSY-14]|uniref:alpha/beta hydrolase n=1 Tax=Roseococcus sp. DSY-14 TaxID=3369650 RepID=UPI00387B4979
MLPRRLFLATPFALAACGGAEADPTGEATPEMRALLQGFLRRNGPEAGQADPPRFRGQSTLAQIAEAQHPGERHPMARHEALEVPTPFGETLPARLYLPEGLGERPPLVVFFGNGAWIGGSLDASEPLAKALATEAGAMLLSVQGRLAPEHRFPIAHEDALSAWRWAVRQSATLGFDPRRMAMAGEGSGANLALATALAARDQHLPRPVALALGTPMIGAGGDTASMARYAKARPLDAEAARRALRLVSRGPRDLQDARMDPARRATLAGLPRTLIVNAQIDPLLDEGAALETALVAAEVPVRRIVFPGVTHGFLGCGAALPEARLAQREMGAELRAGFAAIRDPVPAPPVMANRNARVARR